MKQFANNNLKLLPKLTSYSLLSLSLKNYRTIKPQIQFTDDEAEKSDNTFSNLKKEINFSEIWEKVIYKKQAEAWAEILNSVGLTLEDINKQVGFDTKERAELINDINKSEQFEEKDKIYISTKINDYDDLLNLTSELKDGEYKKYIFNHNANLGNGDLFLSDQGLLANINASHAVPMYISKEGKNINIFPALDERMEIISNFCDLTQKNLREKINLKSDLLSTAEISNINLFPIINTGQRIQSDRHNCTFFSIASLCTEENEIKEYCTALEKITPSFKIAENGQVISGFRKFYYENNNQTKIAQKPPFISDQISAIAQSATYLKEMGMDEEAKYIKTTGIPSKTMDEKDLKKRNPGANILNAGAKEAFDIQRKKGKDGIINH